MAKLLTTGAKFICQNNPTAQVTVTEPVNIKVKAEGTRLLTDGAIMTVSGVCPLLNPLTPPPCPNALSGWQATESDKKAGSCLLTEKSFKQCIMTGGKIAPISSGQWIAVTGGAGTAIISAVV